MLILVRHRRRCGGAAGAGDDRRLRRRRRRMDGGGGRCRGREQARPKAKRRGRPPARNAGRPIAERRSAVPAAALASRGACRSTNFSRLTSPSAPDRARPALPPSALRRRHRCWRRSRRSSTGWICSTSPPSPVGAEAPGVWKHVQQDDAGAVAGARIRLSTRLLADEALGKNVVVARDGGGGRQKERSAVELQGIAAIVQDAHRQRRRRECASPRRQWTSSNSPRPQVASFHDLEALCRARRRARSRPTRCTAQGQACSRSAHWK